MTKTQSLVVATEGYDTVAEAMMALQTMLDNSLAHTLEILEAEGSRLWSIEAGTHAVTPVQVHLGDAPARSGHLQTQYVVSAVVLITYQEP